MTAKLNIENVNKKLLRMLCVLIPLNLNYNCKYTAKKIFGPLVYAAVENVYLENVNTELINIPNSDSIFYHIKMIEWRNVLEIFQGMIRKNYLEMRRMYRLVGKVKVAIDFHDIPYYGKDNSKWVIRSKKKNGTTKFFRIGTVDIVKRGRRFTLAIIPINTFKSKRKVVEELIVEIRRVVEIECILMDRGFESIEVYRSLNWMKKKWITPVKKNTKIVKVMDECAKNGVWKTLYRLQCNKDYVDVKLLIYPTEDGDLVGFFTNMDVESEWVAKAYPDRWGIETGYRVKKEFRAKTRSTNFTVRLLFILMSIILYNSWVSVNVYYTLKDKDTVKVRSFVVSLRRLVEEEVS